MVIDKATFKLTKVSWADNVAVGSVIYDITVKGVVDKETVEYDCQVEYRTTIEYMMSNGKLPVDHIKVHVESKLRNYLEKKGIQIKEIEIEWSL